MHFHYVVVYGKPLQVKTYMLKLKRSKFYINGGYIFKYKRTTKI